MGRCVGKPGIAYSLVGGATVEWIESSETPDKGFGVTGNRVPVWTPEFQFRFGVLLGESGHVVRTEGGGSRRGACR